MKLIKPVLLSAILSILATPTLAYYDVADYEDDITPSYVKRYAYPEMGTSYGYRSETLAANEHSYNRPSHARLTDSMSYERSNEPLHDLPKQIGPQKEKVFIFSPKARKWAAYDAMGERVAYGRANGGDNYCPDLGKACHSPSGTFRVHTKGTAACKSRKFPIPRGGAPMPYCMYFSGGYAIHGSPYISYHNGSHGCIRVTTPAAQWLHSNFINHGTKVMVLPYM